MNSHQQPAQRVPVLDGLAWIMMVFLFVLLAMVWTVINTMQKQNEEYWAEAAKEHADVRKMYEMQQIDINAIGGGVISIKEMMLENHSIMRRVAAACPLIVGGEK